MAVVAAMWTGLLWLVWRMVGTVAGMAVVAVMAIMSDHQIGFGTIDRYLCATN